MIGPRKGVSPRSQSQPVGLRIASKTSKPSPSPTGRSKFPVKAPLRPEAFGRETAKKSPTARDILNAPAKTSSIDSLRTSPSKLKNTGDDVLGLLFRERQQLIKDCHNLEEEGQRLQHQIQEARSVTDLFPTKEELAQRNLQEKELEKEYAELQNEWASIRSKWDNVEGDVRYLSDKVSRAETMLQIEDSPLKTPAENKLTAKSDLQIQSKLLAEKDLILQQIEKRFDLSEKNDPVLSERLQQINTYLTELGEKPDRAELLEDFSESLGAADAEEKEEPVDNAVPASTSKISQDSKEPTERKRYRGKSVLHIASESAAERAAKLQMKNDTAITATFLPSTIIRQVQALKGEPQLGTEKSVFPLAMVVCVIEIRNLSKVLSYLSQFQQTSGTNVEVVSPSPYQLRRGTKLHTRINNQYRSSTPRSSVGSEGRQRRTSVDQRRAVQNAEILQRVISNMLDDVHTYEGDVLGIDGDSLHIGFSIDLKGSSAAKNGGFFKSVSTFPSAKNRTNTSNQQAPFYRAVMNTTQLACSSISRCASLLAPISQALGLECRVAMTLGRGSCVHVGGCRQNFHYFHQGLPWQELQSTIQSGMRPGEIAAAAIMIPLIQSCGYLVAGGLPKASGYSRVVASAGSGFLPFAGTSGRSSLLSSLDLNQMSGMAKRALCGYAQDALVEQFKYVSDDPDDPVPETGLNRVTITVMKVLLVWNTANGEEDGEDEDKFETMTNNVAKIQSNFQTVQSIVLSMHGAITDVKDEPEKNGLLVTVCFGLQKNRFLRPEVAAAIAALRINDTLIESKESTHSVESHIGLATGNALCTLLGSHTRRMLNVIPVIEPHINDDGSEEHEYFANTVFRAEFLMQTTERIGTNVPLWMMAANKSNPAVATRNEHVSSEPVEMPGTQSKILLDTQTRVGCDQTIMVAFSPMHRHMGISMGTRAVELYMPRWHLNQDVTSELLAPALAHAKGGESDYAPSTLSYATTMEGMAKNTEQRDQTSIVQYIVDVGVEDDERDKLLIDQEEAANKLPVTAHVLDYHTLELLAPALYGSPTQRIPAFFSDALWVRTRGNPVYLREAISKLKRYHESPSKIQINVDSHAQRILNENIPRNFFGVSEFASVAFELDAFSSVPPKLESLLQREFRALTKPQRFVFAIITVFGGKGLVGVLQKVIESCANDTTEWVTVLTDDDTQPELATRIEPLTTVLSQLGELEVIEIDDNYFYFRCTDPLLLDSVEKLIPEALQIALHKRIISCMIASCLSSENQRNDWLRLVPTLAHHYVLARQINNAYTILGETHALNVKFLDEWILETVSHVLPMQDLHEANVFSYLRGVKALFALPGLRGLGVAIHLARLSGKPWSHSLSVSNNSAATLQRSAKKWAERARLAVKTSKKGDQS